MHGINIHLNDNPFTFNTDCISKLFYMIVTQYQNKMLYNRVFFITNLMNLLKIPCIHRTYPNFNNNVNYVV